MSCAPEMLEVPVRGGIMRVARWPGRGPDAPVAIAAHGITATHASWGRVGRMLDGEVTLLAPDFRGRGGSNAVPGPFGMAVHAGDLVAVLDHLSIERAAFAGHSMGGFVVASAAARHPERVASLVIADGGIKLLDPPPNADVEAILGQIIGPSLERLKATFPTREDYRAFWRAHPAFAEPDGWNDDVIRYIDYDLVEAEGAYRSGVALDAVLEDSKDTLLDPEATTAIFQATHPLIFLRAARGVMGEVPGIYSDDAMDRLRERVPQAEIETVDANHFTLLLGAGARVVAERLRKAAAA